MFEKRSFLCEIRELLKITQMRTGFNTVVWFGEHPGFAVIYTMLIDLGIYDVEIVDNSLDKQGKEYYAYGYEENNEYKRVIKFPASIEKYTAKTLVLLSNTHYDEISAQLAGFGIGKEQIIDLLSFTTYWMMAKAEPIITGLKRLEGRELQLRELGILKQFKDYCTINDLRFYLAEGSLIGAIRHRGFIPWDDDIDIFMPFEDYVRFIENYPSNENYEVCDWRLYSDYPFQFAKFIDNNTILLHPCMFGYTVMGCCIDVFPIAGYPSDKTLIEKKWRRNRELDEKRSKCCCVNGLDGFEQNNNIKQEVSDEKYALSFYDSEYIGTMQQIKFAPWVVRKEAFEDTIQVKFEDDYYPAPAGYDEYLTTRYGDYMTLPPVEKRVTHPYPTYLIKP